MPINRVCFARAAVCRRHGADSVGNSGQREEEESIVKFLCKRRRGVRSRTEQPSSRNGSCIRTEATEPS